jgi:secreted PhoX family phosphatase
MLKSTITIFTILSIILLASCSDSSTNGDDVEITIKDYSVTPHFLKNIMPGVTVYSLIGSDDKLDQSPNFIFGGSADGTGLLKNSDGTFTFLVNHEDNFSVSRITLDKSFKPVKGEYLINSDLGLYRLCSATMATPEEHGFGPTFITCGESSAESQALAINPYAAPMTTPKYLTAFGRWSFENAVPLKKDAYPGKTVVVIGDDDSSPIGGGQLAMYIGNTGDLDGGKLYVMTRDDGDTSETSMKEGQKYNVTFKQIQDQLASELNTQSVALGAVAFGRTEDIDYQKGTAANGRNVYFTTTGQKGYTSRTKYGRVYRLVMDPSNPLKGEIECILDGDVRPGKADKFQDPDNICVTTNYVYIQEDPNGYGDETHDSYIYQYNIASKELKIVCEINQKRGEANPNNAGTLYDKADSKLGTAEYGALIDISDLVGIPDVFLLSIQPHGWRGEKYVNPDGGTLRPAENQASQIVILQGLPR